MRQGVIMTVKKLCFELFLVVATVMCAWVVILDQQDRKAARQREAMVVTLNSDEDTVNPRLSDKEMFGSDMTIVVPSVKVNAFTHSANKSSDISPEGNGLEDADTVNPHVKGADIGAEIMAVNNHSNHHRK